MSKYTKPFYIEVAPVGSKFARALQGALAERVANRVLRVLPGRTPNNRLSFCVTQRPLNKIQQFERFKANDISSPLFETDSSRLREHGPATWFARTLVNSTNGRGIVEFVWSDECVVPAAPLYTRYIPKRAEYRFHVFNGQVIDVQQKKKKRWSDADHRIRNLHNGYVYCRDGVSPPDGAANLAVRAVEACNYLYGAVDIIYNEKRTCSYVLEVNSRPGLMGTTSEKYAEAIINCFNLSPRSV